MRNSNRPPQTPTRCGGDVETNSAFTRKSGAPAVNDLMESGMATCAARLCSIRRGRVRGHSGARICAPRAHRCSPLSTFVVCAPCVIAGGGCSCSGASIDERARPDAAARCSTSACITRSAWDHRALRQIDALPRFRGAPGGIGAPRWLPCALWPPQASRARVFCVGRGPGAQGRCIQCMGRLGRAPRASDARYSGVVAHA